jgi:hypothetical protein
MTKAVGRRRPSIIFCGYWDRVQNEADEKVLDSYLGRLIHESRLLQMRSVKDVAVVAHRNSFTTKQMQ